MSACQNVMSNNNYLDGLDLNSPLDVEGDLSPILAELTPAKTTSLQPPAVPTSNDKPATTRRGRKRNADKIAAKSTVAESSHTSDGDGRTGEPKPKRGRGRPAGSTNRNSKAAVAAAAAAAAAASSAAAAGPDGQGCGGVTDQNDPVNAARERSRVKTLREAFLELQRSLPSVPPDTKLSKLDVLVLATTYISHLMRTLDDDQPAVNSGAEEVTGCGGVGPSGGIDKHHRLKANGYLHPVKKWPMRSRLYAGASECVLEGSS